MAWYHGTFACRHEGRVNIIGPTKDRQWKADRKFEGLCPECYEKYLQEEREKQNAESAEKAKEMELPELQGTEKQAAWANTLRQKFIENIEKFTKDLWETSIFKIDELKNVPLKDVKKIEHYILENKASASYWIDYRQDIMKMLAENAKEALKPIEENAKEEIEKQQEEQIKAECTVRPKDSLMRGACEIAIKEDRIYVSYEKNDEFREIVKKLGYSWDGIWERKINELSGSAEDRAAELGNKLLNAGFPITIMNENIRQKAVKGEYEPECERWIMLRSEGEFKGQFAIKWWEKNDKLYNRAKSLPGAHWNDRCMILKIWHYKEVQEFADLYGFKFTKAALKAIEDYKKQAENVETVSPTAVKEEKQKDGLEEILNSGSEILDDLKD